MRYSSINLGEGASKLTLMELTTLNKSGVMRVRNVSPSTPKGENNKVNVAGKNVAFDRTGPTSNNRLRRKIWMERM